MAKSTVADRLREELAATQGGLATALASVQRLKIELDATKADVRVAERKHEERGKEIEILRSELHDSEIRCAQLEGYLKAISDMEPPQMVAAKSTPHIEQLMAGSQDEFLTRYGHEQRQSWWNRKP